ncbi:thiamine pyrophosphate-dependent enzyme [Egicoccus sp. AB-alg2]|uniref:thiamine pyrophosphate-dependent enzyme n=1 Tax=Egicoccus sp. AB-alg2 TaxID=3242693 RepID=UPI00359DFBA7
MTSSGQPGTIAADLLAAAAQGGVRNLWMTTGSDLTSFQEAVAALRAAGVPTPGILTAPHEHVGLSAAIGETMVTGGPSMTAVHADLGLLHHGGAIHNALMGQAPVLMMSGYPPVTDARRTAPVYWYQQRFDQGEIVRQYVRWDYKLSTLDDAGRVAARALQVARSAPTGPVYLAVPDEVGRAPLPAGRCPGGPAEALPPARLGAGPEDLVSEVARRLLAAERPLFVTERSGRDPATVAVLSRLLDRFAIGVVNGRFRVNVEDGHGSLLAADALGTADVVVALESPVPWIPAAGSPDPQAWVALVGSDPLNRDIPLGDFPAAALAQADPHAFLLALEEALAQACDGNDRERIDRRRRGWLAPPAEAAATPSSGALSPALVAATLDEVMDETDLLVSEVFDTSPIRRTRPGTMFEKGASSLGWAQAAAVGARYASGDTPTVAVTGDGSYLFGAPTSALWLQEAIDTPVLTVVLNNGGYRTGTTTLRAHYPDGHAMRARDLSGGTLDAPRFDFASQAAGSGAHGVVVESPADLVDALRRARKVVEDARVPAVVDVHLPTHRDQLGLT